MRTILNGGLYGANGYLVLDYRLLNTTCQGLWACTAVGYALS